MNRGTTNQGVARAGKHAHVSPSGRTPSSDARVITGKRGVGSIHRIDAAHSLAPDLARYPQKLSREAFYSVAYPLMLLSRRLEERLVELFEKGYVKGTVAIGIGNEATAVGMAMPFRPGQDVVSLLHRDLVSHLLLGASPYDLVCQYMANADSPTHGREGNVHHGDAAARRLPMISHLGSMLSLVVGGTWNARQQGEDIFGLTVIGDGGTSTGDFHESLNLAAVHKVPVVFLIENNHYSFSTPTSAQYACEKLSDRAAAYGISGMTIDGTDPWTVYDAVWETLDRMRDNPAPAIIECMSLRLCGHAVYDKAEYVDRQQLEQWRRQDPVPAVREKLRTVCDLADSAIAHMESVVEEEIQEAISRARKVPRPSPVDHDWSVFDNTRPSPVQPVRAKRVKNGTAVNKALEHILAENPRAFLLGLDVGTYGSAFKTCKGLIDRFGPERVVDLPICESGTVGFALGASQTAGLPIVEFQFADFSTEATTQLGMNAATWYFRSGQPAPMLLRLPCGGGLTVGAFHSGEFEGLWTRFPGLKVLYPATAQETFEALLAGFHDRNPCLVLEHKQLYWSQHGDIDFDGDVEAVWRCRQYTDGTDLTVVTFGAMVRETLSAAAISDRSLEVINPFVLQPMDISPIVASVEKTGRLLVVQEAAETAGLGNHVIASVLRSGCALKCRPKLVAAPDVPVPFAPELEAHSRPDAKKIATGIAEMFGKN